MISVGEKPTGDVVPAFVDGEITTVDLGRFFGEEIVVLAFVPSDFSPACTPTASDLREFELFTMQKDVEVVAVSPDSVYSHRAFAEEYDLTLPLVADTRRAVAEEFGLRTADERGQALVRRAVVVLDHHGEVAYTWSADDLTTVPDVDDVRDAVADIGGDATAFGRYRVGHAHYTEGRRAFTNAMGHYESSDWMLAQGTFESALAEFEDAADHFDSANRFAESPALETLGERSNEKATVLGRAADWLSDSASEFANGEGELAQRYREDAERPLETARTFGEPVDPDDVTIADDGEAIVDGEMEHEEPDPMDDEGYDWRLPNEDDGTEETDAELEAAVTAAEEELADEADADAEAAEPESAGTADQPAADDVATGFEGIDPEVVEQSIRRAELDVSDRESAATTEDWSSPPSEDAASESNPDGRSDDADDEEVVELDLTDPTAGEDPDDAETGW
ncbi:redoxin domain-containing protein [Haloarculaceae archaeon H-GB2-1]|nr:redoxin domain-containing protein [Haloarculaceae archaeon H-GB1-1]MEA5389090.1 redoxin domain-containing protein [Haloarculaceae archaeon H-GB11]MEA5407152.1 redoxin domain-containing protein [Haloarculaceae archaeon H-GB2-1]